MNEFSKRTVLKSGKARTGAVISLVHRTEGLEIAGAGTRPASENWGYLFALRDGTNGGTWFKTLAEAEAKFNLHKV